MQCRSPAGAVPCPAAASLQTQHPNLPPSFWRNSPFHPTHCAPPGSACRLRGSRPWRRSRPAVLRRGCAAAPSGARASLFTCLSRPWHPSHIHRRASFSLLAVAFCCAPRVSVIPSHGFHLFVRCGIQQPAHGRTEGYQRSRQEGKRHHIEGVDAGTTGASIERAPGGCLRRVRCLPAWRALPWPGCGIVMLRLHNNQCGEGRYCSRAILG